MSERKNCVRCGRPIDIAARSCPYCNWWQADAPPASEAKPMTPAAAEFVPPPERRMQRKLLGVIAFAALLVIAFVVGSFIHGFEPSDIKAAEDQIHHKQDVNPVTTTQPPANTKPAPAPMQPNIQLVPVPDGAMSTAPAQQPMNTVPAQSASANSSTDATAMTSGQYGAAQTAQAPTTPQPVDPRSLTGTAFNGASTGTPASRPHHTPIQRLPEPTHVVQTQPVPEYQPVPGIRARGTARLGLTIDSSGRVRDIEVLQSAQGDMGRLIGAVQSWRFRPAMENGQPVPARFTVEINFNGR